MNGVERNVLTGTHLKFAWVHLAVTSKTLVSNCLMSHRHPSCMDIVNIISDLSLGRRIQVHQWVLRLSGLSELGVMFDGLWCRYIGNSSGSGHRRRYHPFVSRLPSREQLWQRFWRKRWLFGKIISLYSVRENPFKILFYFFVELIFAHGGHLHNILLLNTSIIFTDRFVTASWNSSNIVEQRRLNWLLDSSSIMIQCV